MVFAPVEITGDAAPACIYCIEVVQMEKGCRLLQCSVGYQQDQMMLI